MNELKSGQWRKYIRDIREVRRPSAPFAIDKMRSQCYSVYDSSIEKYQEEEFLRVLQGEDIISWVQSRNTLTVVDLMSSTGAIASIFERIPSGIPKFGLAVSLEDMGNMRSDSQKERDRRLNIEKLDGDIILPSTWRKIEKKLEGRKADLIMERAAGGTVTLPHNFGFYEFVLGRMWKMLNENGMLLLQTPPLEWYEWGGLDVSISALALQWARLLKNNNIDFVFDGSLHAMRIIRTPNSPEKLPFLR